MSGGRQEATVDTVEALTGYRFADTDRLEQALTHSSYAHEHFGAEYAQRHNERLEFVGDAVINLCATTLLDRAFPHLAEGELTRQRQELVNTRALGRDGRQAGLDRLIRLGRSESGKASVELSIVGNAVEALIGAMYLDGGLAPCLTLADRWLGPRIAGLETLGSADRSWKDPRTMLQEYTQEHYKVAPEYRFDEPEGPPHRPTFRVEVLLEGRVLATAKGPSKKAAIRQAALTAWHDLTEGADRGEAS